MLPTPSIETRLVLAAWSLALLALPTPGPAPTPSDQGGGAPRQEVERAEEEDENVEPAPEPPRPPGRRRAVGGLGAVHCSSTITLDAQPDSPLRLETTYAFPDRVRWSMSNAKATDPRQRRQWFRFGTALWRIDPGSERSIPSPPEERALTLLQMELRRVALVWPADLEWTTAEGIATARLAGLGELRAELDAATGRPSALELRVLEEGDGAAGEPSHVERFEELRWREQAEREWPSSWVISVDGARVGRETFDELRPGGRYLDAYFQPVDRRDSSAAPAAETRKIALAPRIARRKALEAGVGWPAAFATADEELERCRKALAGSGWHLSTHPAFEVDREGRPTAVVLRLEEGTEGPLPEGWQRLEGGEGLSVLMRGLRGLTAARLEDLATEIPAGRRGGVPYARVERADGKIGLVQLVLPILAGE